MNPPRRLVAAEQREEDDASLRPKIRTLRDSLSCFVGVVAVFIILGPPIGALTHFALWILLIALAIVSDLTWTSIVNKVTVLSFWINLLFEVLNVLKGLALLVFLAVLSSFFLGQWFGFVPALGAGIIVGARFVFGPPMSRIEAAVVGLVVGVAYALFYWNDPSPVLKAPSYLVMAVNLIIDCTVATVLCWKIVMALHFADEAAPA